MLKRYKRKATYVQAEIFDPDKGLPEGVEETLTPGKFWFKRKSKAPVGGRSIISGQEIRAGDFIIYRGTHIQYALTKGEFDELYEEVFPITAGGREQ